jgi:glutathione S-transferase
MLAYLRYRRIPYALLIGDQNKEMDLPEPKVSLLPTFYLPDEQGELQAVVDSTPIIRRFEAEITDRSALPPDPVLGFLNYLIEDYADEWLTKPMFHYRWYYDADIDMAGTILPRWSNLDAPEEQLQQIKSFISQRQISRLYVVGSNDETAATIEESYKRFLSIMDALIQTQPFIFGSRPASADFALYAQLTQLAKFDPTPAAICLDQAPRVYAWTDLVDDLSGVPADEGGWMASKDVKQILGDLLTEIGRVYVPALLANAAAIEAGSEQMQATIDGRPWSQPSFPYQAKCLAWIRQEYKALDSQARAGVDEILAGTGCEGLVHP